ncbi:MAG: serine/threonine protein kinase [Planctomycetes bacterium]|nr:serine/threonine protein kinase [Planctomycetota bacterium]
MAAPEPMVLVCSSCRRDHLVTDFDPAKSYTCTDCAATLTTRTVMEAGTSVPTVEEPLPDEVVEARKDPQKVWREFVLVRELGRGGAGVVFKAWDTELGRWVALKTLHPNAASVEDLARFRREGKMAARIDHPNIAPIYDFGEANGIHFIAMKFVDGSTLEKAGLTDVTTAVKVIREACRGVAHAHRNGIIHRDLKPQNIMIDRQGGVFVLDFGLAKPLDPQSPTLTATQGYMGTPAFMSPEQARGLLKETDKRTDVYSMGATLWSVLAGRHPHTGQSAADIMVRVASEPTPSIRSIRKDVPSALDAILLKAMAKERDDRHPSCTELGDALEEFLKNPKGTKPRSRAWLAASVLLFAGLAVAAFVHWRPDRRWARPPGPGPAPSGPGPAETPKTDGPPGFDPGRVRELRSVQIPGHEIRCAAFSPDGRLLATAGKDRQIRMWDGGNGSEVRTLTGHAGTVWSVAFSPDGRTLASVGEDNAVRLWNVGDGSEIRCWFGHARSNFGTMSVAFHPEGKLLATGGDDGTVRLWKVDDRSEAATLRGHGLGVTAVAFRPDGKELASGSNDMTVRLWDAEAGTEKAALQGHTGGVWCIAYDPAGKMLASCGVDATIRVWSPSSAKEIRTLAGHTEMVRRVAFHPRAQVLVSAGDDTTVRLWDLAAGKEVRVLAGHVNPVWALAVASDGSAFVTGAANATLRWWGDR